MLNQSEDVFVPCTTPHCTQWELSLSGQITVPFSPPFGTPVRL